MAEIFKFNEETNNEMNNVQELNDVSNITEDLLNEVNPDLSSNKTFTVPISGLALLGTGISALIPELRTVTQTTSFNVEGLFRVANANPGDVLKMAKNGNAWGSLKTATGASKMVQLSEVGAIEATSTAVMAFNPAILLVVAALYAIEMKVQKIEDMQKQIMSFLETDRESDIESDVETMLDIIKAYKYNFDNELFVSGKYNQAESIKKNARKYMLTYKKEVASIIESKKLIVGQSKVDAVLKDLQKKFVYYRMSLYAFTMATFVEILLSENYKEDSIRHEKEENEQLALEYREIFAKCSMYLEKMASSSIESNVLKGLGTATKTVGNIIGSIPVVKEGLVDEFLQDSGEHIKESGQGMQDSIIETFAKLGNPRTGVFLEKMEDLMQIYNHTTEICIDNQKILLKVV